MGRLRRSGPRPQLSRTEIQYETLERLKDLKRHRDEPLFSVYDRACAALEEQTDNISSYNSMKENIPKIQKRLTEKSTDVCHFIEVLPKEVLQDMLNEQNRNGFSEDTIVQIRKQLGQTVLV